MEEQLACLERCRAHLLPHGRLVLDLPNPDPAPPSYARDEPADGEETAQLVDWTDGRRIRWWMTVIAYDRSLQVNECEVTYEIIEADGAMRRITETISLRYTFRYELEHLLVRAGFRIVALHGDYDRSPFGDESPALIVVAEPAAVQGRSDPAGVRIRLRRVLLRRSVARAFPPAWRAAMRCCSGGVSDHHRRHGEHDQRDEVQAGVEHERREQDDHQGGAEQRVDGAGHDAGDEDRHRHAREHDVQRQGDADRGEDERERRPAEEPALEPHASSASLATAITRSTATP